MTTAQTKPQTTTTQTPKRASTGGHTIFLLWFARHPNRTANRQARDTQETIKRQTTTPIDIHEPVI